MPYRYSEKRKRLEREKQRREAERNYPIEQNGYPDYLSLLDFMTGARPDKWTGVPGSPTKEQDMISAQIRALLRTSYSGDEGFQKRQEKIDSLVATLRALQGVTGQPVKKRKIDVSGYQDKFAFDFAGKDEKGNYIYNIPDVEILSNLSLSEKRLLNQYLQGNISKNPSKLILREALPQHLVNAMREKSKLKSKDAFNRGLFESIKGSLSMGTLPQLTQAGGMGFIEGRLPQREDGRQRSAEYIRELSELGDIFGKESDMERERYKQGEISRRAQERAEKPATPKSISYYIKQSGGNRDVAGILKLMDETNIMLPKKIDIPEHSAYIRSKNAQAEGEDIFRSIKEQFGRLTKQGLSPDEAEKRLTDASSRFIEQKSASGLKFKYNSKEYISKLISRAKFDILYDLAQAISHEQNKQ